MATLIVYPAAGTGGGTSDTYVGHSVVGTWASIQGGAGTVVGNATLTTNIVGIYASTGSNWAQIRRALMSFDTSAIGAGQVVSAATLSVWVSTKQDGLGAAPLVNAYGATPATIDNFVATDYAQCGTTPFATDASYASMTIGAYTDLVFNAAGIAAINPLGKETFALRWSHDALNTPPTWAASVSVTASLYSADQAGTTNDPKLTVTYAAGAEAHSGTIAIKGGGVYNSAATKDTSAARVLTGGGVCSRAASKGGQSGSALTGGGVYSRAAQKGALLAPIVTGGGVYSRAAQKGTSAVRVLTGGGVYNRAATKSTSAIRVLTGGGVVLINGAKTSGETHFGAIAITGGGVYSRTAQKGALLLPVVTGGGVYNRAATKSAPLLLVVTGGGVYLHGHIPLTPPVVIQPVVGDDQMSSGRGRRTPFDDWTLAMDDEAVIEIYLLGKTR